ncbi:MAG: DNRLRE domain-containing protein [Planctomycetes bacterium]|nr:DNRLRE domain-containing protein [Planctomycetota bacterium]
MRSILALSVLFAAQSSVHANVVTITAAKDNTLYAESQTFSNGAGTSFFAGNNGIGFQMRGLLQFDLAGNIPTGSTINSVQLVLNMTMTNSGAQTISLHRVLADWGEGTSIGGGGGGGAGAAATPGDATWLSSFHPSIPWTTPGGDFSATASTSTTVDQLGVYTWPSSTSFVADAQAYLNSPTNNFGWLVFGNGPGPAKRFASRENTTVSMRPQLIVDFTPPFVGFCFGDGTGTACPCGNAGLAGNGCGSSSHPNGANLAGGGTASIANDTLVILGSGMSSVGGVLYFQGTGMQAGGAGIVFGDGLFCAGGSILRLGVKFNTAGASQYPDLGDPSISVKGLVTTPGSVRHYQGWYRDAATFCNPETFNFTNGLTVTWGA